METVLRSASEVWHLHPGDWDISFQSPLHDIASSSPKWNNCMWYPWSCARTVYCFIRISAFSIEIVVQAAWEVGVKTPLNSCCKLTKETRYLIKKGKVMKVRTRTDEAKLGQLTKLISRRKVSNVHVFKLNKTDKTKTRKKQRNSYEKTAHLQKVDACKWPCHA